MEIFFKYQKYVSDIAAYPAVQCEAIISYNLFVKEGCIPNIETVTL